VAHHPIIDFCEESTPHSVDQRNLGNRLSKQIVYQSTYDPRRVGQIFGDLGFESDRRCPNLGDPLPATFV
ncbi:MAG: hypothetical protein VX075_14750, partial [Pseudomonadota bacterium]|nr:hypothetical protein [Pseudomonadota bacterium]